MGNPVSVDNFVDRQAFRALKALQIKAFTTLHGNQAKFYLHINQ
jgi:hypothetical protein